MMLIYKLLARLLMPIRFSIAGEGEGGGAPAGNEPSGGGDPAAGGSGSGSPAEGGAAGDSGAAGTGEGGVEGGEGDGGAEGDDEVVIKIGDEELPPAEEAKPWVKRLRQRFRDQSQELARLRAEKGAAAPAPAGLPPAPGPKPKINDDGIEFDSEKFAAALDKWHEASRKREEAERKAREQQSQEQRDWEQKVAAYQDASKKLGLPDFEECEATALSVLSTTQQAIVVESADSAEKAALAMYSLGRNMGLLQELAKIANPIKFAVAVADFQRKLTVTRRKPTTKPEKGVPASSTSGAAVVEGQDKKLNELREEAIRTGDMTKLMAHRRQAAERKRA